MAQCTCQPDPVEEFVKVQGSDVYFHCDVCEETVLELNTKLRKLALELRHRHMDLGLEHIKPEIRLFIRSDGGDLHAGMSAMDCIAGLTSVKIRTIADGVCASAATFLLLGGRTRHATENSYVLIHQLSSDGQWGRFEEFKNQIDNLEKFMKRMKDIYLRETRVPGSELKRLLRKDMYLDAQKCLEWSVIDSIWRHS